MRYFKSTYTSDNNHIFITTDSMNRGTEYNMYKTTRKLQFMSAAFAKNFLDTSVYKELTEADLMLELL